MQDVESMRHLAEMLETRAQGFRGRRQEYYMNLVERLRIAADEMCAFSLELEAERQVSAH